MSYMGPLLHAREAKLLDPLVPDARADLREPIKVLRDLREQIAGEPALAREQPRVAAVDDDDVEHVVFLWIAHARHVQFQRPEVLEADVARQREDDLVLGRQRQRVERLVLLRQVERYLAPAIHRVNTFVRCRPGQRVPDRFACLWRERVQELSNRRGAALREGQAYLARHISSYFLGVSVSTRARRCNAWCSAVT